MGGELHDREVVAVAGLNPDAVGDHNVACGVAGALARTCKPIQQRLPSAVVAFAHHLPPHTIGGGQHTSERVGGGRGEIASDTTAGGLALDLGDLAIDGGRVSEVGEQIASIVGDGRQFSAQLPVAVQ
ncbi:hypothetical protein OHB12_16795 [Nocardia sp. NBC_01730]|uniref:hypothetical protein n=1 Tax=Nocardia sp. NBC_01730 TaxID=2975998 RepID=UPI002E143918|nr:hypothetical protein OHB12_16795 [Nocardia sp. NBC_01730]